jgi:hypothetical protein
LKQGVQVASGTLVPETNHASLFLGIIAFTATVSKKRRGESLKGKILLEAVPENTSGVLHDAYIGCDVGLIVLDQRNILALPGFVK